MVDKASDYQHITPPDCIEITGDIYPVREKRKDGSHIILRGEDVCFLNEAAIERGEASGITFIHPVPQDNVLTRTYLKDVFDDLETIATRYIDVTKNVPTTFDGGSDSMAATFDAYCLRPDDLTKISAETPILLVADVRNAYVNLSKFGRVICPHFECIDSTFTHVWEWHDAFGRDKTNEMTETGLVGTMFEFMHLSEGTVLDGGRSVDITSGQYQLKIDGFGNRYKKAEVWLRCKVERKTGTIANPDLKTYDVLSKVDCTRSGDVLTLSFANVQAMVERLKGRYSLPTSPVGTYTIAKITLLGATVLCTLRDHTDISSIEWDPHSV